MFAQWADAGNDRESDTDTFVIDEDEFPVIEGIASNIIRKKINAISKIVSLWNHGDRNKPNSKPYKELHYSGEGVVSMASLYGYRSIGNAVEKYGSINQMLQNVPRALDRLGFQGSIQDCLYSALSGRRKKNRSNKV